VPLNYLGDAIVFLTKAKGIVEGQWIWHNNRLGAPFGADFLDFPLNITLDSACLKLLALFTTNIGLIVNTFWLGAVSATAAIATYCLRRLNSAPWVAVAIGVVYALQPYGFFRGISHLHSLYYLVPLIATGAIELTTSCFPKSTTRNSFSATLRCIPLYLWVGCAAVGFAYAYTAFFSCFALTCATALSFAKQREKRVLLVGAVLVALICAGAVLDLSMSLVHWARQGRNFSMDFKYPAEADIYGLKLRFLFTPIPNHPIAPARVIEERLRSAKFPLDTENESTRLGTVGAVGFAVLIGTLLLGSVRRKINTNQSTVCIGGCAALCMMCILLATVGGFGGIFNTFVITDIRCYNRIAPFIAFYSVVPIALGLTAVHRRWTRQAYSSVIFGALLFSGTAAAAFDQAVVTGYLPHETREATYRLDRNFVQSIESILPSGSSVFELPYMGYPVEYLSERLFNNDRGRPYVHSTKYRWTWAAVSGTTAAEWNRQVASQPVPEMLHNLYHAGFSGIWVDLFGYNAQNSPEGALSQFIGAPHRNPDGRFLFYDMRAYKSEIAGVEAAPGPVRAEHPVQTLFERGFYDEEKDGSNIWHWARKRGRVVFINPLKENRSARISMTLLTGSDQPQRIRISGPNIAEDIIVRRSVNYARIIALTSGGQSFLTFQCDCKAVKSDDPRDLRFEVLNLRIID
jgi:phosphoglycerol transferase